MSRASDMKKTSELLERAANMLARATNYIENDKLDSKIYSLVKEIRDYLDSNDEYIENIVKDCMGDIDE